MDSHKVNILDKLKSKEAIDIFKENYRDDICKERGNIYEENILRRK
ncbi:hypothetical protein [Clostridium magnum]|uniref:Uncharacterized protein n=1 Tax=Clostridium magnum DSM 2767 TaxID=1121326 RepID=A0A162UMC0_9CLOT|nr:hypothetical protein [Clostridium magnum]KZL94077.1 hypothetical protein CLMAG_11300 [Clostridium magnum DSM 2767]SHH95408.1 hypothetical protein SAMN02745944_01920 [Clostridium magnum DSM 2767]